MLTVACCFVVNLVYIAIGYMTDQILTMTLIDRYEKQASHEAHREQGMHLVASHHVGHCRQNCQHVTASMSNMAISNLVTTDVLKPSAKGMPRANSAKSQLLSCPSCLTECPSWKGCLKTAAQSRAIMRKICSHGHRPHIYNAAALGNMQCACILYAPHMHAHLSARVQPDSAASGH